MKITIDVNYIEIVGWLWQGSKGSYNMKLDGKKMVAIGEATRDNVQKWLKRNAGDFEHVIDFHAVVGEMDIPWATEEGEMLWEDCNPGY